MHDGHETVRGHQGMSRDIRGYQMMSEDIRGYQETPGDIGGHPGTCMKYTVQPRTPTLTYGLVSCIMPIYGHLAMHYTRMWTYIMQCKDMYDAMQVLCATRNPYPNPDPNPNPH